jgi:cell division septation protein DedD
MDSRAKQRLTGAVILVALFVLLVPELLTGPRGRCARRRATDEGMRRYTIDLDASAPSRAADNAAAQPPSRCRRLLTIARSPAKPRHRLRKPRRVGRSRDRRRAAQRPLKPPAEPAVPAQSAPTSAARGRQQARAGRAR